MIRFLAACLLLTVLPQLVHAAAPQPADPKALAEVNRLLEDELKVASKPQVYLVLDPYEHVLLIKSRGLELFRFPVLQWNGPDPHAIAGVFRLRERPPVSRPKAAPVDDAEQLAVIELKDMPDAYELIMDSDLVILVSPRAREHPWAWAVSRVHGWWWWLRAPGIRQIRLTLSEEATHSLAWSAVESMPLLIGRTRDR